MPATLVVFVKERMLVVLLKERMPRYACFGQFHDLELCFQIIVRLTLGYPAKAGQQSAVVSRLVLN